MQNDSHHLHQYEAFRQLYNLPNLEQLVQLYDIYELVCFLPANPTEHEKQVLQELMGAAADSGYLDYQRSTNTFELIMSWMEQTGNLGHIPMPSRD